MNDNLLNQAFILVFRTSINRKKDVRLLMPMLNACPEIINWHVDITDIDNVLRIESTHPDCLSVIEKIKQAGYMCEELNY
ncbi:hypothetical protein [Dyadobacter sediminis]|uniref:Copper chaperone n=1 Tax=Dyadobacter sediminis TaxID=1493691 RepID=A0A5R9KJH0_9BACT|nr:hypothetical protein [Dyadobacter sediminis]TLU96324.1 hypothetical protein FEM55_04060 [Dyadobacter sediminis]